METPPPRDIRAAGAGSAPEGGLPGAAGSSPEGNLPAAVGSIPKDVPPSPAPRDRRLATVLFTDLVASTERAASMGDLPWRELLTSYHRAVRDTLPGFAGREIGSTGDGFLATFEDPEQAVRCACALREAIASLGLAGRTGLHTGEVVSAGPELGGIAVHIGARVMARAREGEVLASSTVRDLVTGSDLRFEDRGAHSLKGVPGHWRLFAVTEEAAPRAAAQAAAAGKQAARAARAGVSALPWRLPLPVGSNRTLVAIGVGFVLLLGAIALVRSLRYSGVQSGGIPGLAGPDTTAGASADPGIAVLPFSVRGSGLETWREGLVDLLSVNLDGVAGLRTIDSRTVLARWREGVAGNSAPDLVRTLDVARRTGARYALLGSAVAVGDRVRLAADVYDLGAGTSLGQAQVSGSPDSLLALVDLLSVSVLRSILRGRDGDAAELPTVSLARVTTSSLPALKAYLDGEILFRRSDFEGAIVAYQRAVEADPGFALAYYRLGSCYSWTEMARSDLAQQADEQAARLADRLPEREAILVRAALALHRGVLDGLAPLREAVRRYPEDAEAWYLLGDTYYHLGSQALIGKDETERALERAIELDPSFTPAYIHLLQRVFNFHPDSARAAQLVARYGELAAGSEYDRRHRVIFALAYGDSAARADAWAVAETLDTRTMLGVARSLWYPAVRDRHEQLLRSRLPIDAPAEADLRIGLFQNNLSRGRLRSALRYLESSRVSAASRAAFLSYARALGFTVDPQRLRRDLLAAVADSSVWSLFYMGVDEAERGRWTEHARLVTVIQAQTRALETAGDSAMALKARGLTEALEGYALWRRGEGEQAFARLQRAQRAVTGPVAPAFVNEILRWWLGDLALELGRPGVAEQYFRPSNEEPLAAARLGRVYEELGEVQKAREGYQRFLAGWRDADPALQPLVLEAEQAVARLTGIQRR